VLTTNQIGAVAETAIIHEAVRLGIGVFKPVMDERCDLILDLRPTLLRVQCKAAVERGGGLVIRCYSSRRSPNGHLKRLYTPDEIDAIAAYSPELRRCFLLPMSWIAGRKVLQLRIRPTHNNQELGVNWAKDFEFTATLSRLGAIAQLGERQSGTLEVAGSSPAGSTLTRLD
jgi:PD-(D/E)XK endonuclease